MGELRQAMVDLVLGAGEVKACAPKALTGRQLLPHLVNTPASAGVRELNPVVGEHGADPVRHVVQPPAEEVRRDPSGRALMQLRKGELADPIDGPNRYSLPSWVQTSAKSMWIVPHRIGFERLARSRARGGREAIDPAALQQPMQPRTGLGGGSSPGGRRGNHQEARGCADGTRRSTFLRRLTARARMASRRSAPDDRVDLPALVRGRRVRRRSLD